MKFPRLLAAVVFSVSAIVSASLTAENFTGGDVQVDGVHLCCGKCLSEAKKSLTGIEGVSKVRVNKSKETVIFEAANAESAAKGLRSMANAGFYGMTSIAGPAFDVDESAKQDKVALSKLHLCCGGCVRSAVEAVESVAGVETATPHAKEGTIDVSGSSISLLAVQKALHEAGFHGTIK